MRRGGKLIELNQMSKITRFSTHIASIRLKNDKLSTLARVSTVDIRQTIERSPDTDVYRNK